MKSRDYVPRKLKFRAWNKKTNLMMRLHAIDCQKGELVKSDHILLQYTGFEDSQGNEIYDQDILVRSKERFVVEWIDYGWFLRDASSEKFPVPVDRSMMKTLVRLGNVFELAI